MELREVKLNELVVGKTYYDINDIDEGEKMEFIGCELDDNNKKIACLFKSLSDDSHYLANDDGMVGFEIWGDDDEEDYWYEEI